MKEDLHERGGRSSHVATPVLLVAACSWWKVKCRKKAINEVAFVAITIVIVFPNVYIYIIAVAARNK